MEKIFFSKQNLNIIYNVVQKKIINQLNYNINDSNKFKKEIIQIMKTIYNSRNRLNIPEDISELNYSRFLSQKVINMSVDYFKEIITKNSSSNINKLNPRPISQNRNNEVKSKHDTELKLRNTNQNSNNIVKSVQFNLENENISNNDINDLHKTAIKERGDSLKLNYNNLETNINNNVNNNFQDVSNKIDNSFNDNLTDNFKKENRDNFEKNTSYLEKQFMNINSNKIKSEIETSNNDIQKKYEEMTKIYAQDYNLSNNNNESLNIKTNITENSINNNIRDTNNFRNSSSEFNFSGQMNPNIDIGNKLNNNITPREFKYVSNLDQEIIAPIEDKLEESNMYNPIVNNQITEQFTNEQYENNFDINQNDNNIYSNNLEDLFNSNTIDNSKIKSYEEIEKNIINKINIQDISELIKSQQNNIENTNKNLSELVSVMQKQDLETFYKTIINLPHLIQQQKKDKFITKKYSLVISSKDRDFSNNEFNKYNFKVNFGGNTNNTIVRDNFNTVANTKSNIELKNNTESKISFKSNLKKNPSVSEVLRNIYSIKIKRIILPKPRCAVLYPEPYYFLVIDEFDGNVITSKDFNEKIFCKLYCDKDINFGNTGRQYLYYSNDDHEEIKFYHSPLAKLSHLTLKIVDSRGRTLDETWADVDLLNNIYKSNSDYEINTSKNFNNNTFEKDELYIINNDNSTLETRVSSVDVDSNTVTTVDNLSLDTTNTLVNLSNQTEFIFEVITMEHDINSKFNSEMI